MMKAYFEKTESGNQVIITDGITAKVFDGAPDGVYEGVDLYGTRAKADLADKFHSLWTAGDLSDYDSIYSDDEIEYTDALDAEIAEYADLFFEAGDRDDIPTATEGIDGKSADEINTLRALGGAEAARMAAVIRVADDWMDVTEELEQLCRLAGMEDEWRAADGDTFEAVVQEAADIMGVSLEQTGVSEIEAYASYDVLAREKQTVYTVGAPASDIYDVIWISIPGETAVNEFGETCYDTGNGLTPVSKLLTNVGGRPALRWFDGQGYKTVACKRIG